MELKPNFYAYTDFTIRAEDGKIPGEIAEIRTSKTILAAFSEFFKILFKKEGNESLEEMEISVLNSKLFLKLIISFHDLNTVSMILDIKDCRDQLSLMIMCSEYSIPIPYEMILDRIEIPDECFPLFLELLNHTYLYNGHKYIKLITRKFSDKKVFNLIKDEKERNMIENMVKTFMEGKYFLVARSELNKLEIELRNSSAEKFVEKLWSINTEDELVKRIIFSSNGKLALINFTYYVKIINLEKFSFIELSTEETLSCISISPDGSQLATGDMKGVVTIFNPLGEIIRIVKKFEYILTPIVITFSPNNKLMAIGGEEEEDLYAIEIWNLEKNKSFYNFNNLDKITSLTFSPDGTILAIVTEDENNDSELEIWNISTKKSKHFGRDESITALCFSPDGNIIAFGTTEADIFLMNVIEGSRPKILSSNAYINSLSFSSDGELLVSGDEYGTITIWNSHNGEIVMKGEDEKRRSILEVSFIHE